MAWFIEVIRAWICGLTCNCPSKDVSIVSPALSHFDFAFAWVFKDEGGFSNHPADHGGATKYGITKTTLSEYRKRTVTIDEVKALTQDEAKAIYHAWYWNDVGLDKIKNKAIATCIFDTGILIGPKGAINFAHLAANQCAIKDLTIADLKSSDTYKFLSHYRDLLKARFDSIVASDSSQLVFYTGWMNRANRLLTLASVS